MQIIYHTLAQIINNLRTWKTFRKEINHKLRLESRAPVIFSKINHISSDYLHAGRTEENGNRPRELILKIITRYAFYPAYGGGNHHQILIR